MWRSGCWQGCGGTGSSTATSPKAPRLPTRPWPCQVRSVERRRASRPSPLLGGIAYWQGRADEAVRWYEEQLSLARELGDRAAEADATFNLSYGAFIRGNIELTYELMDAARELYVELGDARGEARTEWSRATAVMSVGQPADALPMFEAAAIRFAELDDAWYHAMATGSIAWVLFATGDMVGASHKFVESLIEYHALRDIGTTAISLQVAAIVALEAGRPEDAAVLFGAMETLSERYGVKPPAGLAWLIKTQAPEERVAALLEPDVLAAALERGRRLSLDEAVELVVRIESELPAAEA